MHSIYSSRQSWLALLSLAGLVTFAGLYGWSATLYPGGSTADPTAQGFDWRTNYWCDLLAEQAKNGQPNTAAPVAMFAMGVFSFSLIVFWLILPALLRTRTGAAGRQRRYPTRWLIQYPGVTAMLVAPFIASAYHDAATNLASALAAIPVLYTLWGLYQTQQRGLFWTGMWCGALLLINQFIYQTGWQLQSLPLVQKITFAAVLGWLGAMNWQLYRTGLPTRSL